jgi:hypothetical protein
MSVTNKINATINIMSGTNQLKTAVVNNRKALAAFMDGRALFSGKGYTGFVLWFE